MCFMHLIDALNKAFDKEFNKTFDRKIDKASKWSE